jgi:hypothetical protein
VWIGLQNNNYFIGKMESSLASMMDQIERLEDVDRVLEKYKLETYLNGKPTDRSFKAIYLSAEEVKDVCDEWKVVVEYHGFKVLHHKHVVMLAHITDAIPIEAIAAISKPSKPCRVHKV